METSTVQNLKSVSSKLVPFINSVAVYFILFLPTETPSVLSMIIKCLPILSLMLFVIFHGVSLRPESVFSRRIFLGLLFSCLGDAFLVWPQQFILGMLSFAVAQVMYILAFGFDPLCLHLGASLYVISALALSFLLRNLEGVLLIGVPVYSFLLTTMVWRTMARVQSSDNHASSYLRVLTCLGGIFWIISDGLLGFHLFYQPLHYSQGAIMGTYFMGQLGIALSVAEQANIKKEV